MTSKAFFVTCGFCGFGNYVEPDEPFNCTYCEGKGGENCYDCDFAEMARVVRYGEEEFDCKAFVETVGFVIPIRNRISPPCMGKHHSKLKSE